MFKVVKTLQFIDDEPLLFDLLHLVGYGRFPHAHLDLQFAFDRTPPLDNLRTEEKIAIKNAEHIKGGDTADVGTTDAPYITLTTQNTPVYRGITASTWPAGAPQVQF